MKIIGIIPARYNSQRLSNKPLININGKPLIQCTYEAVLNSKVFDLIYITTDSEKIKKIVEQFGAKCILTSIKHRNGTERCVELINKLKATISNNDLIVNTQCDEPFLEREHFEKIISLFNNPTAIGTLICPLESTDFKDQSIVKVMTNSNHMALDFKRTINSEKKLYKHIGIYAYKVSTLLKLGKLALGKRELNESLEQLRWLENNYRIHCGLIKKNVISINTKNDLKKVIKNIK